MRALTQLAFCSAAALAACSVAPVTFTPADDQAAEDCNAAGDEDGNGLANCNDPACANALACQPACGNGKIEAGEGCDDGNATNGDSCEADCRLPACGNHIVDAGEACDDGNRIDADGCEADCSLPACGNGIVDAGEGCDDGAAANGTGQRCNAACRRNVCGDGDKLVGVEECDDGNPVNGDACDTNCTTPRCGNNAPDPGEACDDGNSVNGDGCEADCSAPRCGNRIVDAGEACDDGDATSGCDLDCTLPRCNDGQLNLAAGEEVDPPASPSQVVRVSSQTCRFDFSAINQLFCAGTCGTWGGGNGCQQADADAFCKLKTGNPNSTAITFALGVAAAAPGICCPSVDPATTGCTTLRTFDNRGVPQLVSVHETSLVSTHGPGQVITNVTCTDP